MHRERAEGAGIAAPSIRPQSASLHFDRRQRSSVGVIIVAAGSSRRMEGIDKLWIDLGGQPLLARTISALAATPGLAHMVVATGEETLRRVERHRDQPPWSAVDTWVRGGAARQDSVYNALCALRPVEVVLVHDAARPLVSPSLLARAVAAARAHGAAIAATLVTDTIKVVDEQERITATPDRTALRAAQTPQAFKYTLLRDAYERVGAARSTCTDDGAVAALAGFPVYTFPGEHRNLKVSTPADLALLRALWDAGETGALADRR